MGIISRRRLFLSYTMQQVIPNICTKFQNPRFSSPEKSLTKKKVYTKTHTPTNIVTEKTKNIAESEQSSHTPGRSHQRYVETIL